jgi:FlaA1/EpsC-like NDP-sugar epimerase
LRVFKRTKWTLVDLTAWQFSAFVGLLLRFETIPNLDLIVRASLYGLGLSLVFRIFLYADKSFFGRYVNFTSDEVLSFFRVFLVIVSLGSLPLILTSGTFLPRSFAVLNCILSFTVMLTTRFIARSLIRAKSTHSQTKSALIYGAGFYSEMVIRQMLDKPESEWKIDGIIDDDPAKANYRILGIRVLGNSQQLARFIEKYNPDLIVVAVANLDSKKLQLIDTIARGKNISVHIVPSLSALLGKKFSLAELKPLDEVDLIGRKIINVDIDFVKSCISNKRILVTGAGGSIGSELSRQLSILQPAFLGLLDRDESGLLATQLSINNEGLLTSSNLILADIRDKDRIEEIFAVHKPEIVFHAAALKHLPLLESNPEEAWKTNVVGTLNMLELSRQYGVDTFVNISTDKAADPISVLGYSKLLTERLTSHFGRSGSKSNFISVRFGNVFGSRGSVIGTFSHQIKLGGPVTVTDPQVSRYFMTIHEAVHLVLRATRIGQNGETLVLDMGDPVKIVDIAKKLIARSAQDIEIRFSGVRKGEKIHEVLFSEDEDIEETIDPMIKKTIVRELDSSRIEDLANIYASQVKEFRFTKR